MSDQAWRCEECGAPNGAGAARCTRCGTDRPRAGSNASGRAESSPGALLPSRGRGTGAPTPEDLLRRVDRLAQWADAARPLGLELPRCPSWTPEAIAHAETTEPWAEALGRLEQEARHRADRQFREVLDRLAPRLTRLEAYSIETRQEREQVDEASRAARSGDLALALWMFPQVDRVVAVKERHLEQTRAELERLLGFLHDVEAIGLGGPERSGPLASELEAELRAGHLSALRQRARQARALAAETVRAALAGYVAKLGDRLVLEHQRGLATGPAARDLAEGARRVLEGQTEEGVRLLRRIGSSRGVLAR